MPFTKPFFEDNGKTNFEKYVKSMFSTNDSFSYMEIGTFEGESLLWMCNNFPKLKATVIDPFIPYLNTPEYMNNFLENLKDHLNRIDIIKGFSQNELILFKPAEFDLIYIDGDHNLRNILEDAVLSYRKLKTNGYLIMDDINWGEGEENTQATVNNFVNAYTKNKILIS